MTSRTAAGCSLALAVGLSLGACDDGMGMYGQYYPGPSAHCERFKSCETCTPQLGCGWCTTAAGSTCLSDPIECSNTSFTWTWERSGCGVASDAGNPPPAGDGGSIDGAPDDSGDAGPDALP